MLHGSFALTGASGFPFSFSQGVRPELKSIATPWLLVELVPL